MPRRLALTALILAASGVSAQAGTLTTSLSAFTAGAGGADADSSVGIANGDTVASITLANGAVLGVSPGLSKDNETDNSPTVPYADGYAGDVFLSAPGATSVTISGIGKALGFTVATLSTSGFPGTASSYTVTVTSSDGLSVSAPAAAFNPFTDAGLVGQFFGHFGGGADSLTITDTDPNGFVVAEIVDAPEPAAFAVLSAGLLALTAARRARG